MNDVIRAALDAVFGDLEREGAPVPSVENVEWQDWQPSESVRLRATDGSAAGVWLDLSRPDADQLAQVADQVQDWAVEELGRLRRPTNWPRCDAHPTTHPQVAQVIGGRAVWACPAGLGRPRPIGV